MNPAAFPGPGDEPTWPRCMNHPNDPRTPAANLDALRETIRNELRYALIRRRAVDWGHGGPAEFAADAVHGCGLGNADADDAWLELHSAIANGASDADVAALARHWHRICTARCVEDLVDCAMDGRCVRFPVRGGR